MPKTPKKKVKSYGTSTKWGVSADVEVPIVKTGKPEITVVKPGNKKTTT